MSKNNSTPLYLRNFSLICLSQQMNEWIIKKIKSLQTNDRSIQFNKDNKINIKTYTHVLWKTCLNIEQLVQRLTITVSAYLIKNYNSKICF